MSITYETITVMLKHIYELMVERYSKRKLFKMVSNTKNVSKKKFKYL